MVTKEKKTICVTPNLVKSTFESHLVFIQHTCCQNMMIALKPNVCLHYRRVDWRQNQATTGENLADLEMGDQRDERDLSCLWKNSSSVTLLR
jgi:hypothetical protein